MTTQVDIVNLALQSFGSRTTVTAAELSANGSNEAKQVNITYDNTRNSLLRMAPWNCAMHTANLTYITSIFESTGDVWIPGLPRPPWAYEYQYPTDCLKPTYLINNAPFKVGVDSFVPVTGATVSNGGTGYTPGTIITIDRGTRDQRTTDILGAPPQLRVTATAVTAITSVEVVSQVLDAESPFGGSYYGYVPLPMGGVAAAPSIGTGATFILTQPSGVTQSQRVILTNEKDATLVYVKVVTDPNIWDPLFQDAMANALGANICIALTGDKSLANMCIQLANASIIEARKSDGNEGLTINDLPPDWIRARGFGWTEGPHVQYPFDWGGLIPSY